MHFPCSKGEQDGTERQHCIESDTTGLHLGSVTLNSKISLSKMSIIMSGKISETGPKKRFRAENSSSDAFSGLYVIYTYIQAHTYT